MDIYYELSDKIMSVNPKKLSRYMAEYNVGYNGASRWLMQIADRAWREHDGKIVLVKNRFAPFTEYTPIDMKEFFFIKLSARDLYGS